MYVVKNCPQCGVGEGIYTEYPLYDDFGLLVCFCCGFQVRDYFDPQNDEERNPTPEPGHGIMRVTYDMTLELGRGKSKNLPKGTDYEKVLAWYDRLVLMGIIIPEKSYVTKADGNDVLLWRGEVQNIKNSFHEDDSTRINRANGFGESADDL